MSEFDAFDSEPAFQNTEEDPAAAFLAREQTELAGLEDDNFTQDNSVCISSLQLATVRFSKLSHHSLAKTVIRRGPDHKALASEDVVLWDIIGKGVNSQVPVFSLSNTYYGANQFDMFTGEQPQVMNGDPADFMGGSGGDDFGEPQVDLTNGPTDAYSAITSIDRERQEPEKLRIWREEQRMMLEKKDAEESQKKEEWRDIAKKELDDWYKHHGEQVTKTRETNREAEEAFVKDRDTTQPGGEWEKICRLCEFNPKNSKNTKDVSRMRSILLQLKQTPLVR